MAIFGSGEKHHRHVGFRYIISIKSLVFFSTLTSLTSLQTLTSLTLTSLQTFRVGVTNSAFHRSPIFTVFQFVLIIGFRLFYNSSANDMSYSAWCQHQLYQEKCFKVSKIMPIFKMHLFRLSDILLVNPHWLQQQYHVVPMGLELVGLNLDFG